MENECYEEEVQPYRKTDYKPIIYIQYDSFDIIFVYQISVKNIFIVDIKNKDY